MQSPIKIILNVITDLKLENKSSEESNCALTCSMDGWRRQSCNCNAKIKRILAEFYCFVIWIIDNEQLFKQSSPSRSVMSNMILSGLCNMGIYRHLFVGHIFGSRLQGEQSKQPKPPPPVLPEGHQGIPKPAE